jgi:hypothetical protein
MNATGSVLRPPCKDCKERSVGCHSSCGAYIMYSEENARLREERHNRNEVDRAISDFKKRVYDKHQKDAYGRNFKKN